MAKKGQKFKRYTKEFKVKVVKDYLNGKGGYGHLTKIHNIPAKKTIRSC